MILAIDVDYRANNTALAAGVLFSDWQSEVPTEEVCITVQNVAEYIPGQFYKRELPCILAVLQASEHIVDTIVVDGFVSLGNDKKPGLGQHLWETLEEKIPVIGVAKSAFKDTPSNTQVWRGTSAKPLYVTSVGIALEMAKVFVQNMHGEYRLPTLLKRVDYLCRQA